MAVNWQTWTPQETAVLLFLLEGDQVLLIHKKRGLGKGKINAPGGRVEPGESWEEAARRETQEETGLSPQRLTRVAELRFQFTDGYALEAHAFLARGWTGVLAPCDEADPFWHPVASLPWQRMWADDALWLPQALNHRFVSARFLFDGEVMREADLTVGDRPPEPSNG